jgi:predicted Zn-dependent protease
LNRFARRSSFFIVPSPCAWDIRHHDDKPAYHIEREPTFTTSGKYLEPLERIAKTAKSPLLRRFIDANRELAGRKEDAANRIELNNGPLYEARLAIALRNYSPTDIQSGYALKWEYDCMRQYTKAEEVCKDLIAAHGRKPGLLVDLSCYVGKQGRFQEALELGDEAAKASPDDLRAAFVRVLWVAALARRDEAMGALKAIKAPSQADPNENAYWLCMAYAYARLGDEDNLAKAMANSLKNDYMHWAFDCYQRDVTFDAYRARAWFIEIAGRTLRDARP